MRTIVASFAVTLLAACSPLMTGPAPDPTAPLPEFSLLDVNAASATGGRRVGPQDLRGKVSSWYFTHST